MHHHEDYVKVVEGYFGVWAVEVVQVYSLANNRELILMSISYILLYFYQLAWRSS